MLHTLALGRSNLDSVDRRGYTALHRVLRKILVSKPDPNDISVAGALILQGADLYMIEDRWGHTAENYLMDIRDKGVVATMLFGGTYNLNQKLPTGYTVLQDALRKMLLAKKLDDRNVHAVLAGALIIAGANLSTDPDPYGHTAQTYLNKVRNDDGGAAHRQQKENVEVKQPTYVTRGDLS